ncbi:MAG: hypothetical protein JW723_00875 [Bacteroidales bacterium]|nr:hypothetical protein [Bacteroidales bacterium]
MTKVKEDVNVIKSYKHSGRVSLAGALISIAVTVGLALAIAIIYALFFSIHHYLGWVIFYLIWAIELLLAPIGIKAGKVRNVLLAVILGAISFFLIIALGNFILIYLIRNGQPLSEKEMPIWYYFAIVTNLVAAAAIYGSYVKHMPFDEERNKWFKKCASASLKSDAYNRLKRAFEDNFNPADIADLKPVEGKESESVKVKLFMNPDRGYLDLTLTENEKPTGGLEGFIEKVAAYSILSKLYTLMKERHLEGTGLVTVNRNGRRILEEIKENI